MREQRWVPGAPAASLLAAGLCTLAALPIAACGQQPEPSQLGAEAQVREDVLAVVRSYPEYLTAQNWDSFLGLFWPNATLTAIRRPEQGSQPTVLINSVTERVAEMAPILAAKPLFEANMNSPAVFIEGDLGMVWAPSETRIGQDTDPTSVPGVDAFTLLEVGGEWKVISLAFQADAVENPLPEGGSRQSLLTMIERYYSDLSSTNWSRFASHFWPGATIDAVLEPSADLPARTVTMSAEEFIDSFQDELEREAVFEIRMGSAQVLVRRNLAQVWASYRVRLGDANVSEWSGVNAFTLIRFRNRWRIASLAYDSSTPRDRLRL